MRTPLQDTLTKTALVPASEAGDPARQLALLFEAAQRSENQYAAERLSELHQLAERALTLGAESARERLRQEARPRAAHAPWPQRVASLAAGGLLAACAPLVAEASILLAAASGLAALAAIALPFARGKPPPLPALPGPDREGAKLASVASAADRALQAMTEPRALPPPKSSAARPDDDVLGLLQDALALAPNAETQAERELAENAARLARHLGYEPTYDGPPALFETMVDPSITEPLTLRPALVHRLAGRTVPGVRVRKA